MKLATVINDNGATELGLVNSDATRVARVTMLCEDLGRPAPEWSHDMLTLLQNWEAAQPLLRQLVERMSATLAGEKLAQARLAAPLPRPTSLRDCVSFEQHWIQTARAVAAAKAPPVAWLDRALQRATGWSLLRPPAVWRKRPIYYKGNPASVIGHGGTVRWPAYSKRLDFELEIAVYIGREGVDLTPAEAASHVAGYSLFNDFSARDVQFREMRGRLGPGKSKDFDTGNSLGPFLATPDEVDFGSMRLEARVNDELWVASDARTLYHSVADTVAFISQSETLYPGDVIGLGTVPGGSGIELGRWLQPGDRIELSATGLGVLANRISAT
ncbi:MAG: fumarylacetoacetate hydrolase family protein [Planctomycetales bacterium]|nr:fumarylacetoacetate hydrolase family protein [Planctomycetales bacterium]